LRELVVRNDGKVLEQPADEPAFSMVGIPQALFVMFTSWRA
jgi:hypothetical protein